MHCQYKSRWGIFVVVPLADVLVVFVLELLQGYRYAFSSHGNVVVLHFFLRLGCHLHDDAVHDQADDCTHSDEDEKDDERDDSTPLSHCGWKYVGIEETKIQ